MNITVLPVSEHLYIANLDNKIYASGYSITEAIGKLVWTAATQLGLNINIKDSCDGTITSRCTEQKDK